MNSQKLTMLLMLAGFGCLGSMNATAELTIPGLGEAEAGCDGALTVNAYNENRYLNMYEAPTGDWNTCPEAGKGVYDPERRAVVYKFSSVNISGSSGYQRVHFRSHSSNAPVVWLVSGDVHIGPSDGIYLDGGAQTTGQHAVPGPGGYWGGINPVSGELPTGAGFGPGGGQQNDAENAYGGSGSYGSEGNYRAGPAYGNVRLLPLIGGSGGAGYTGGHGGSAGGGAILIVSTGTVRIEGAINARGGTANYNWNSGLGSGGAIRIVADTLEGFGYLYAYGYSGNNRPTRGGAGRIRLEANNIAGSVVTNPLTYVVAPDDPVLLWPPDDAPTIEVVSIAGEPAPAYPNGTIYAEATDVVLADLPSGDIVLTSTGIDPLAAVEVRIVPKYGEPIITQALHSGGDLDASTWTVSAVELPEGIFVVQARAVNP